MRWDNLRLDNQGVDTELAADQDTAGGDTLFPLAYWDVAVPLIERGAVARTFGTPGFRGMTFFEVQAKSVVNRVPGRPGCPSAGPSTRTGASASMGVSTASRAIRRS